MKPRKLLIIDDDKVVLSILKEKCQSHCQVEILTAMSYKEGVRHILENKGNIHAAIVDLNLPDAHKGEMADFTLAKEIPTVILTGIFDENLKNKLMHNDILDYIHKDGKKGLNNAISSIERVLQNYGITVLVVDDSKVQRDLLKDILESIKLNVLTASDGEEALELIKNKENNISLVLTDYNMPKMDGMELTIAIREVYDKDELGIIVLSSIDHNDDIATQFIKIGANDYLDKPYKKTAVTTRVNSIFHTLDLFRKTKELSYTDFMTGAYNRRYFYSSGQAIFDKAKREKRDLVVATLDIDKFKNINDTYGHDVGDICIIRVVELLQHTLRSSDLVARFGGEEFVVLLENISKDDVEILFEKIRVKFEENEISSGKDTIKFTTSIGICYGMKDTLDEMIKVADDALYYCKENGRNQILIKN